MTDGLIPRPARVMPGHGSLRPRALRLATPAAVPPRLRDAVELRLAEIGDPAGDAELAVDLSCDGALGEEAYSLSVREDGIAIAASSELGLLHGARTLLDVWMQACPRLPLLQIVDEPAWRRRGVFVECSRGPDLMELTDWRALIRGLGQLKLNLFAFGIHNCWDMRHDGDLGEYLFVPLDRHPELRANRRMRTWEMESGDEVEWSYLPRMFEADLFGPVVAAARAEGMLPLPVFGGPAHSTLIPRTYPVLSARDEDDDPVGYGFCTGRAEARDALARIADDLVTQHLDPAGIEVLGVGGDEYYSIRNVDPDDPLRSVSPVCRGSCCRDRSAGRQLREYLYVWGERLAQSGIAMMVWHDSLVREGELSRFVADAAERGWPPPTVSWWNYTDPPRGPDLVAPAERWVTPTTGLIGTLFAQDTSLGIAGCLAAGADADGVLAYSMPDPAHHRNFACLADLAWTGEAARGPGDFKRRWALATSDDADRAEHADLVADSVLGCHALVIHLLDHLLPYFATAPRGVTRFPDDVIRALGLPSPALETLLTQVAETLDRARRERPPGRDLAFWPGARERWDAELARIADHTRLTLAVLEAARVVPFDEDDERGARRAQLEERGRRLLRLVAHTAPGYHRPAMLREHWSLVREIGPLLDRIAADPSVGPKRQGAWHAWML